MARKGDVFEEAACLLLKLTLFASMPNHKLAL